MDELPTFGTWEAIEKLGEGGACEVFRVRHRDHPEREVAIKVLADPDPEAATRFVAEARLLMRIDHPNVIRVHELDAEVTPPWLAMDLLSGKDLDEE
ncbi:MAG: protein kinase, partial [Deltaproteobacteria bacterium]|nr:protein kinase [Deltaproteobacteria bacterium]